MKFGGLLGIGALLVINPLFAATPKLTLVLGADQKIVSPFATGFDKAGALYFVEMTTNRFGKMERGGRVVTLAGTGERGFRGDSEPAAKAQLNGPHHLAIASDDSVFVSDTWNNRVRRFDPKKGFLSTFAGTGEKGFSGDGGPAEKAQFGGIYCAAFDPKGENLYIADLDNRRIRAINMKTRQVSTVAGNGKKGVPADGAKATEQPLVDPRAVAADAKGNVYVLERSGNALRVVNSRGEIRTVAGTGEKGLSGDDGDALQATMNGPKHLCVDREGNVLIADTENHVIRKFIPTTGKIVRAAGTGKKGKAGVGGPALEAELSQPHGVYVHTDGAIYIADSSNDRIVKVQ
jgi:DNA-binding beta-propeller fold protein YncE